MKNRFGKFGIAVVAGMVSAVMVAGGAQAASGETQHVTQLAAGKKDPGKRIFGPRGGFGCIACHGRNGAFAIQEYPNIAGQDEKYIVSQIEDIMEGKRVASDNAEGKPRTSGMRGALLTPDGKPRMDKDQIKAVAKWLSGLEPAKPKAPKEPIDPKRIKEGEKLYKKLRCMSCHGKEGKKPLKTYPYVAGQKQSYLVLQVKDIRDKVRTNGKSKLMYAAVRKITDEQIESIADYLSQIDRTAK